MNLDGVFSMIVEPDAAIAKGPLSPYFTPHSERMMLNMSVNFAV